MLNGFKILTVTHKNVQLEQISDFILSHSEEEELATKLTTLKHSLQLEELLYIATCNRVIYLFCTEADLDITFINTFLQTVNTTLSPDFIQQVVAVYEGQEAIVHLYEVSSSIDSLVVGEREIMRQIRASYAQCKEWGLTGDNTRLLMKYLVQASKEVYAKTRIGEKQVSIVSLAMHKLKERQLPAKAKILLIGAGQTNTLVSKFLLKQGFQQITVFNRSYERAKILADAVSGQAHLLKDLSTYSAGFDCLIVCTGATKAIIDAPLYQQLLNGDVEEKTIVDLSIPNNVDRGVLTAFSAQYIGIEELKELAALNLEHRKQEIGIAKILLKEQIKEFQRAFKQRQIEKSMRHIPAEIKAIKKRAMEEVFKKDLEGLDEETRALFERMMTYMEKKCISVPMKAAKELVE